MQIDLRWSAGNVDDLRKYAAELVALAPDAILANGSAALTLLLQLCVSCRSCSPMFPIRSAQASWNTLSRPGGNATGLSRRPEYGMSGKWLELLKEIAPGAGAGRPARPRHDRRGWPVRKGIQSVAPSLGVDLRPIDVRDAAEIERGVASFAREANSGLIGVSSSVAGLHRDLIIRIAAEHKLPAVYSFDYYAASGGLIAYGPYSIIILRHAADYLDRILKGAKPSDLPVQAPTKYKLVINLKTAKALGLEILPTLLARADEVIE